MGVLKLVNWIKTLRVDVEDMLGVLDEVRAGLRVLTGRAVDRENNTFVGEVDKGGHVLEGFAIDMAAGLAATAMGAGTYFDQDGLPIQVPAQAVNLAAFAGVASGAIWCRWEDVTSDNANRKRWIAGAEGTFVHGTRKTPTAYYGLSANDGVTPDAVHDWTLIGTLYSTTGVLPADPEFAPNALWDLTQNATRIVNPVGGVIVPDPVVGGPLYGALEYLRGIFEAVRGTSATVTAWDDPVIAPSRTIEAINAALVLVEGWVATLFAQDVAIFSALDKIPLAAGEWDAALGSEKNTLYVGGTAVMGIGDVVWTFTAPIPGGTFLGPCHVTIQGLEPDPHVYTVVANDPTLPVGSIRIRSYAIDQAGGLYVPVHSSYTWQLQR